MPDYDAFISYARSESVFLASDLQSALERFAKPWYRRRILRVFRDDSSMSANAALWSTITDALASADWLILLASERSATSLGVERELTWWLQAKGSSHLLLALVDGLIVWDQNTGDFDWRTTTALPPCLAGAFSEEPRWVDLSWYAQATQPRKDSRFDERVADLAAAVRGLNRDDVVGENTRQHRRALRYALGAVVGLAMLLGASLLASIIAVQQANEARTQATTAVARQLAAQAQGSSSSDLQMALLEAVQAYQLHPDEQTRASLFAVSLASPHLVQFIEGAGQDNDQVTATGGTADAATIAFGTDTGRLWSWNRGTGRKKLRGTLTGPVRGVALDKDGSHILAFTDTQLGEWTGATMMQIKVRAGFKPNSAVLSPSGKSLVTSDGSAVAVRSSGSTALRYVDLPTRNNSAGFYPRSAITLVMVDDRSVMVMSASMGNWIRLRLSDLMTTGTSPPNFGVNRYGGEISSDGMYISERTAVGGRISVWSTSDHQAKITAPVFGGASGASVPVSVAVSDEGKYVASAVDGSIFIGRISGKGEPSSPALVLPGAGNAIPGTLHFLGFRYLVSSTGAAVSLWDLDQFNRIGFRWSVPVPLSCTACPPAADLVSPNGHYAAVVANSGSFMSVVDLETGQFWQGSYSAATWVGGDQLFVYSASDEKGYLVGGWPKPRILRSWDVTQDNAGRDGVQITAAAYGSSHVFLLTRTGTLLSIDPRSDAHAQQSLLTSSPLVSATLKPDQGYALVELAGKAPASPNEQKVISFPQGAHPRAFHGYGFITTSKQLLTFDGTKVSSTDLLTGSVSVLPAVNFDAFPAASPDGATLVFGATRGKLTLLEAHGGRKIGDIDISPGWYNSTSYGFSADGKRLTVAQAAEDGLDGTLYTLDLDPSRWVSVACRVAGRPFTAIEWSQIVGSDPVSGLACTP